MTRLHAPLDSPEISHDDGFEERWAAWQRKGVDRDGRARARLRMALAFGLLLGGGVGFWLLVAA
jgi:hypothetical protein